MAVAAEARARPSAGRYCDRAGSFPSLLSDHHLHYYQPRHLSDNVVVEKMTPWRRGESTPLANLAKLASASAENEKSGFAPYPG
jgi:hypothetical protein